MPLETASYISQLVSTNPVHTDGLSAADSHLRLLKSVLQTQFPSLGAAAATITAAQLTALGTALGASQSMVPTGAMMPFANTTSDPNWLRCNGGTFAYATYPALGAFLGYVSGTCTLPNLEDTGRFVRSVTSGLAVRTSQSNQNAAHTHTGSVATTLSVNGTVSGTSGVQSADHTHGFSWSATTDGQSNSHHHFVANSGEHQSPSLGASAPLSSDNTENTFNAYHLKQATGQTANVGLTSDASDDHSHTYSGSGTTDIQSPHDHTHGFSWTGTLNGNLADGSFTTASSGGTEARPESYAAIWYIHI